MKSPQGCSCEARGYGHVLIQVLDRDGRELKRVTGHNTLTRLGMNFIARRTFTSTPAVMTWMQVGTGNLTPDSSQTNLDSPLTTAVLANRQSVQAASMTMSGETGKWEHTWTAGEFSQTGVQEVGLFNDNTSGVGVMMARYRFTVVNKGLADQIKVTWKLHISL
jgi:hypothetical protein